ncbi:MAG: IS1634 family transposase, partial [Moorellales bacterium]
VTQSRLSDPGALYDLPGWAERYAIPTLYPEVEGAGQRNDDRAGRMLDAIYDQRAFIGGDLIAQAARVYQVDLRRLHADTMAMTFAGLFADQPATEGVPRLEPGYNPSGEWLQQLKLFALAAGDGGLPVWFDALDGGTGDSTTYAPQFAAFAEHARLANFLPLEEVILLGDRQMPTEENQLTWLRLGLGYIGPITMQDHHRQTLQELLAAGQHWEELPYVAQREAHKSPEERTIYWGLGYSVEVIDPEDPTRRWSVRYLYVRSEALADREAARRQNEMQAIEAELRRLQRLVNKYDDKTPEIIARRVQSKAFKKRRAQKYFTIEVVNHPDRPAAPLELRYRVDDQQVRQDAELDGVYLLVAGGRAATLSDGEILAEWKGQHTPGEPTLPGGPPVPEDASADCRLGLPDYGGGFGRRADRAPGTPGAGRASPAHRRVDARRAGQLAPDGGTPLQGLCRLQPGAGQRRGGASCRDPLRPPELCPGSDLEGLGASPASSNLCPACPGLKVYPGRGAPIAGFKCY